MKRTLLLITATLLAAACTQSRVDRLVRQMTVDEKIGQLTLLTSDWSVTGPSIRSEYEQDIRAGLCGNMLNAYTADYNRHLQEIAVNETRLGIPILFGYDVIHGFRTIFPINLGMAASWDIEAIEESARIAGREAAAAGLHWTYSPMCDVSSEPRWGRVSEGSGEDPYLGSRIAEAMVRGYQGEDLSDPLTIAACVKHFAAYGAPQAGRDYNTVDMSERWLREFYLPPYKAAVDAGARTVMASFNELDGVPATANRHLLTEILRDEWGFDGFVVSDYTGIMEMTRHGTARDTCQAGVQSLEAGLDMDMMSIAFYNYLKGSLERGEIKMKTVDQAVRRILKVKEELGLFDDPYRYFDSEREAALTKTPENLDFARRIAEESAVLLKNDGVLPFTKGTKVAVIGELAASADDLLGSWRAAGTTEGMQSILDAIRQYNGERNVVYARGCGKMGDDRSGFGEALRAARSADKVIMVIGEDCNWSGEAACRGDIGVPGVQTELLEQIAALGKPVAVVLLSGRPLVLERESKAAGAILEAWFPGTMGGQAVTNLLFGEASPSGRLPMTFPQSLGQVPIYYYAKPTGRPYVHPGYKYESHYLDIPNEPLYAFGEGLGYTSFEYGEISLNADSFGRRGSITASIEVRNTGDRAGVETVQMYIHDRLASVTRPVRQLGGFERVELQPGESRIVSFTVSPETISFWRRDMTFGPEAGEFDIYIGHASNDTKAASFNYED